MTTQVLVAKDKEEPLKTFHLKKKGKPYSRDYTYESKNMTAVFFFACSPKGGSIEKEGVFQIFWNFVHLVIMIWTSQKCDQNGGHRARFLHKIDGEYNDYAADEGCSVALWINCKTCRTL